MCVDRLSKDVFLLILPVCMMYAFVGPIMSDCSYGYISTNCIRLIKVRNAQCVNEFAESKNDVMNFWRQATLCELCSTSSINDTSG
ncbi:hypothetical protein DPMN_137018 [Dreissena polymorpha]|uniref:Uncharacterized protein n=1 Tax=Dreissena polymorpha TaxID=45954 RepID=A0A9D4G4G0_DREPO|nr:hypothetical protein DPMN_137018 [Dreissena polymorpha]